MRIEEKLISLYGPEQATEAARQLDHMLAVFKAAYPKLAAPRLSEHDVALITYGDSLRQPGQPPLQTLHNFLMRHLPGKISTVHVLPFFPYSSDDGFSVIDYKAVNPDLGTWDHIRQLGDHFKLMFDAVFNHVSAHSQWFKAFLAGDSDYQDFFIAIDPSIDLSQVVRPRNLPLLTAFETSLGTAHIWTTFSADQIDLNAASPDVLLRLIDVLLFYVSQGAQWIRLDAIAYLWKIPGTKSIHLPQTHTVIQLFREVLDQVAPHVLIVTETNVPHAENISYLGDGTNEAQMVYQFTLPPLTLHAIASGSAVELSDWAATIQPLSERTTFFNFTASHDGIGVRPVEDILSREQVEALIERTQTHGGAVSYKVNPDGSHSPYELNINYFDALSNPHANEPLDVQVSRFIVSQAIELAFVGVPGIYIHSLLGSRNWNEGVRQTGQLRTINREKLAVLDVENALSDPNSLRSRVFRAYGHLLDVRTQHPAFHPNAPQTVLALHPALFTLQRTARDGSESIVAVHNLANQRVTVDLRQISLPAAEYYDLLSDQVVPVGSIEIMPYQVMWLRAK